ncbi:MAG: AMP-binding protein [Alphaproteobacteria bacterium]
MTEDAHHSSPGNLPSQSGETLPQLLARNAGLFGRRDAMREKSFGIWRSWTWAEMLQEVGALARGFSELGVKRGDRVVLIGDNRPRLYWSMSALQVLGAVPVPLFPDIAAAAAKYAEENNITPRDCSAE